MLLCHFGSLALSKHSFWDEHFLIASVLPFVFYDLGFALLTKDFCFYDLFCSTKTKTYGTEAIQKHNEPHQSTQKFIGKHKPNQPALPFYTKNGASCFVFSIYTRRRIPENATMPSQYGGDTVLCKQCQVFICLPLVLQTKQTQSLTFLPPSAPDCAYILFPLGASIGYERWSHPLQNTKPQSGTAAATTEEVRSRLPVHTSS